MCFHGAEIYLHQYQCDHHDDSQDRIEVIGNGADKNGESVFALHKAGNGCRPGRDRCDDADRSRSGIDQIGQLRAGNFVLIRNGFHDAAHGETVKIIIDKDQYAECNGGKLCTGSCLDLLPGKMAEGCGTACTVHQADHGAQDYEKYQDTYIIGIGQDGDKAVVENVCECPLEGETGIEQTAHQNTDEQRTVNLFRDQGQYDRDDRRDQCPESGIHGRCVLGLCICGKCGKRQKPKTEKHKACSS